MLIGIRRCHKRGENEGGERRAPLGQRFCRRVRTDNSSGTVAEDDVDDDDNCSLANRRVMFQLSRTVYHEDELRDLSCSEEWSRCWYSADELKKFRIEQMFLAQNVFEDSFRLSPEQAEQALEWKNILKLTYESCESEQIPGLERLYRDDEMSFTGLETNALARLRGKASRQTRSILDHFFTENKSALERMENASKIAAITMPSSKFSRRLAGALANALVEEQQNN